MSIHGKFCYWTLYDVSGCSFIFIENGARQWPLHCSRFVMGGRGVGREVLVRGASASVWSRAPVHWVVCGPSSKRD